MLSLRLRQYEPNGNRGEILTTLAGSIVLTTSANGPSAIEFALSSAVSGQMPSDGFVVGVEYAYGAEEFQIIPSNNLFIVNKANTDDLDSTKTVKYTGESYLLWLLSKTYLGTNNSAKDGERVWTEPDGTPASAGRIMYGMITESKNRGWSPSFHRGFTVNTTSSLLTWLESEKTKQGWRVGTSLAEVLTTLSENRLCDWRTHGMALQMENTGGFGSFLAREMLLGPGTRTSRIPVSEDSSGLLTKMAVIPEKVKTWTYLTNPATTKKYGELEAVMTQSGVGSSAEATKLARAELQKSAATRAEISYEWFVGPGSLVPWKEFDLFDDVNILVSGEMSSSTIVEMSVREVLDSGTQVNVVVGQPSVGEGVLIARKLNSLTAGQITGGSGRSFGWNLRPAKVEPVAPDPNVTVNPGHWLPTGGAASAVTLSWDPVTTDVNGDVTDISYYEVWSNLPGEPPVLDTTVYSTEVTINTWPIGEEREVYVRAYSDIGEVSGFPLGTAAIPDPPEVLVYSPTKPTLSQYQGVLFTHWDGLYSLSNPPGAGWVLVSASLNGTDWFVQGAALAEEGDQVISLGEVGDTVSVRLEAYDEFGRYTGTSATETVVRTGIDLSGIDGEFSEYLEQLQEATDQAAQDAADALTTADGKNARRRGVTEPTPPPGGWVPGDQWVRDELDEDNVPHPVEVLIWNGTEFVYETTLTGELLVIGPNGNIRLADGVVTADTIAAEFFYGREFYGGLFDGGVFRLSNGEPIELAAVGANSTAGTRIWTPSGTGITRTYGSDPTWVTTFKKSATVPGHPSPPPLGGTWTPDDLPTTGTARLSLGVEVKQVGTPTDLLHITVEVDSEVQTAVGWGDGYTMASFIFESVGPDPVIKLSVRPNSDTGVWPLGASVDLLTFNAVFETSVGELVISRSPSTGLARVSITGGGVWGVSLDKDGLFVDGTTVRSAGLRVPVDPGVPYQYTEYGYSNIDTPIVSGEPLPLTINGNPMPGAKVAYHETIGQTSSIASGGNPVALGGAAALSFSITVSDPLEVVMETKAHTTTASMQIGLILTGATVYTPSNDGPDMGIASSGTCSGRLMITLQPGTTTVTLARRSGAANGTVRNPSVLVRAV